MRKLQQNKIVHYFPIPRSYFGISLDHKSASYFPVLLLDESAVPQNWQKGTLWVSLGGMASKREAASFSVGWAMKSQSLLGVIGLELLQDWWKPNLRQLPPGDAEILDLSSRDQPCVNKPNRACVTRGSIVAFRRWN